MIKIAIFGHLPDSFLNVKTLTTDIDNSIAIIKRQHENENDFSFNLNCEPGTSQLFCDILMSQKLPYEIYLSKIPDEASQHWLDKQKETFLWQLNNAKAIHIYNYDDKESSKECCILRDRMLIDNSQWVLVFWNGKHQGFTYQAVEYALQTNKLIYNGLGGIKIIDKNVIR